MAHKRLLDYDSRTLAEHVCRKIYQAAEVEPTSEIADSNKLYMAGIRQACFYCIAEMFPSITFYEMGIILAEVMGRSKVFHTTTVKVSLSGAQESLKLSDRESNKVKWLIGVGLGNFERGKIEITEPIKSPV